MQDTNPPPPDWWGLFMVGLITVAVSAVASASRGEEFAPPRILVQMVARWLLAGAIGMAIWAVLVEYKTLNPTVGVAIAIVTAIAGTDVLTARIQTLVNMIFDAAESWLSGWLNKQLPDGEKKGGE